MFAGGGLLHHANFHVHGESVFSEMQIINYKCIDKRRIYYITKEIFFIYGWIALFIMFYCNNI